MKKRILSMFLAVAMMFSITGVLPVISAEEFDDVINYTSLRDQLKRDKDIEFPYIIPATDGSSCITFNILDYTRENGTPAEILYGCIEIYEHEIFKSGYKVMFFGDSETDSEALSAFVKHGLITDDVDCCIITNTQIRDISPLSGLTNLEDLQLYNNQISDVSPLKRLTNLTNLNLSDNQINDVSPLKGLTNLKKLNLSYNQISDISPLKGLTNLEQFSIDENPISVSVSVTIFDVLEILKSLAGMENELDKSIVSLSMTLLTEESRAAGKPTIFDALEILKKLAGM